MKPILSALLLALLLPLAACTEDKVSFEVIAESPYQWTGVAVSAEGRIFVNFPSWDQPSPYKVAEVVNGQTQAYPSAEANDQFIAVQSVVVDSTNRLWILDTGNPQFTGVTEGGAQLHQVDLATNQIIRSYPFPDTVAKADSYLNDLRVDVKRDFVYLTDSTLGGIIVLDLGTGQSWRALDSDVPAVQSTLDRLQFASTGEWVNNVASDGIELAPDGNTLYFTALTGNVLYQVPTDLLRDRSKSSAQRAELISVVNPANVPTDGMLLLDNRLFMADLPAERLWIFDLGLGQGIQVDPGFTVRWADSFAADRAGNIYFTTSQINYPPAERESYKIYRFKPEVPPAQALE